MIDDKLIDREKRPGETERGQHDEQADITFVNCLSTGEKIEKIDPKLILRKRGKLENLKFEKFEKLENSNGF